MNLMSGSLSPFVVISPCQAMVDVDETYREPLLGEAFYHEKALTMSRVGATLHEYLTDFISYSTVTICIFQS